MVQPVKASNEQVREAMSRQRTRNTRPEMELRRSLHKRGLRFRLHRRPVPGLNRTIDIVFPGPRLAVDVYGCFWHCCPQHASFPRANGEWWLEKLTRNRARDEATQIALLDAGWALDIVWEHEDPDTAAARISSLVRSRTEQLGKAR